jgi:hypothetical protein
MKRYEVGENCIMSFTTFTPSIIRMLKSRKMRWAGHVACTGEKRNGYRILVEKPERKTMKT